MSEERTESGQWPKGVSGNPGGYSKEKRQALSQVAALAREHTPKAIATLAEIMEDAKAPKVSRVAAANALLDRAWGKPLATTALIDPDSAGLELESTLSRFEIGRRIAFALQKGVRASQEIAQFHATAADAEFSEKASGDRTET
jgi:hypothetical protein